MENFVDVIKHDSHVLDRLSLTTKNVSMRKVCAILHLMRSDIKSRDQLGEVTLKIKGFADKCRWYISPSFRSELEYATIRNQLQTLEKVLNFRFPRRMQKIPGQH